ncbi:MAG TPA: hypothetical protein DCY20_11215, partial [Firmicutes bacterium]|nr:hypothetical protein [Bacillota bacterium]
QTIVVSTGADSVDFKLVNLVKPNDIVITQDYGLAAMVLSKNAYVINQNGMIYSHHNIDELLHSRHMVKKIIKSGGRVKGPKKRTKELDDQFVKGFEQLIVSITK